MSIARSGKLQPHEVRSCAPHYSDDPDPRHDVHPPHLNKNAVTIRELLTDKKLLLPPPSERPDARAVLAGLRSEEAWTVAHFALAMTLVGRAASSWRSPMTWTCTAVGAATGLGIGMLRTYLRLMGVSPDHGP